MNRRAAAVILGLAMTMLACACPGKQTPGTGAGTGSGVASNDCEAIRGKIEQMYRADAEANEPKRVNEAVADNTSMVMADCAKAPDQVAACVSGAATVKDIETRCLSPIDDEGSEGDQLVR
ncbi:MAG: hypothetical protein AB7O24_22600 [Kofleriaceae bacterium]